MIARTLALSLASLLALLVPTASGRAAPQGGLQDLVAGELAAAESKELPELWKRSIELRDAAELGDRGELDLALDGWLARPKELSPRGALLASASRLLGKEPDVVRIADALVPLLDGPDPELAAAGAQLLANPAFKLLATSRLDQLAKKVLERAEDAAVAPALRLEFAKAAFRVGGGRERIQANKVLRGFLDSQDPELKAEGALALAELDSVLIDGDLRTTLERLSRIPDANGQLARSYLTREELRREKDRRDTDRLQKSTSSLPPEMEEFMAVLNLIRSRHMEGATVQQDRLIEAGINGMLQYMDSHSSLLPSEAYARFYGDLEAEYGGIGAYVNEDPEDTLFTIVRPIYSGPAYRQGLMTDDKIVRIGDWPTMNHPVDEIIKHLKGQPGTSVDLYIWRRGMDPQLIERPSDDMKVSVVREKVRIPPGTFQMLPGGVGLLQLDEFSQVAMEEARQWIPEMLELGMKAMVLDLRYNGGGLLTEAQKVAELFLPKGTDVVSTEGLDENHELRKDTLKTRMAKTVLPPECPLVVLVGGGTASAAEIVSGALQDNQRAKLVGKTTYGKGSVQQLIQILPDREDKWDDENGNHLRDPWEKLLVDHDDDGEMDYSPRVKLTIARYRLPSGRSIHREIDRDGKLLSEGGVKPDVVVDAPTIEGWRIKEQRRIRPLVKKHVDETFKDNHDLYSELAINDRKRPELYPGFDELMGQLETKLSPDDVRRVLRYEARRHVQDERGAAFPMGDFVEDVQLQKAIEVALEGVGEKATDVADFAQVFDLPEPSESGRLALARDEEQRLSRALEDARQGVRPLSDEDAQRLIEILGTIDTRKN